MSAPHSAAVALAEELVARSPSVAAQRFHVSEMGCNPGQCWTCDVAYALETALSDARRCARCGRELSPGAHRYGSECVHLVGVEDVEYNSSHLDIDSPVAQALIERISQTRRS